MRLVLGWFSYAFLLFSSSLHEKQRVLKQNIKLFIYLQMCTLVQGDGSAPVSLSNTLSLSLQLMGRSWLHLGSFFSCGCSRPSVSVSQSPPLLRSSPVFKDWQCRSACRQDPIFKGWQCCSECREDPATWLILIRRKWTLPSTFCRILWNVKDFLSTLMILLLDFLVDFWSLVVGLSQCR